MINSKRILVVEDDIFLAKIMSNRLEEEGFDVDVANDGQEAIDKLKNYVYVLVTLDLIMPNKNGFEVLRQIKKKSHIKKNYKIPVMVFSQLSQEEDKEEAMNLGANGFYVKSNIAVDDFIETVKGFTKKKVGQG